VPDSCRPVFFDAELRINERQWCHQGNVIHMCALSVEDILSDESYAQRGLPPVVLSEARLLTLDPLDRSSGDHTRRVGKLAGSAAAWLGLNSGEVRVTRCAALLHDLGKVLIPPSILNNPGNLSEGEWAIVCRHPEIGAKLLSEISGYERVREAIAAHHERPDGGGYPAGLPDTDLPIEARLIVDKVWYSTSGDSRRLILKRSLTGRSCSLYECTNWV
jgi:putative nucleotidyltransferase with HDIG domain